MTQGSNPFDSDFEEPNRSAGSGRQGVSSRHNNNNNNPFDDDDDDPNLHQDAGEQGVTPALNQSNPFDSRNQHTNTTTFDYAAGESRDDGVGNNSSNSPAVELSGLHGADASAEASWQYLGDLPYRRVPVYTHVSWGRPAEDHDDDDDNNNTNNNNRVPSGGLHHGLAAFPSSVVQHHPDMLDEREVRALLNTTTVTKVAGCPHGGPIAAVTLPIVGQSGAFAHAEVRIMNAAGVPLSTIDFPPPTLSDRRYVPADIMTIGFTDRYVLMIVLRDSLCLTYRLNGDVVLPPFNILPRSGDGHATELLQARTFDGGVAVLSSKKHAAVVEFLDDHDPPEYYHEAHMTARRILPEATAVTRDAFGGGGIQDVAPPHFAIVTHLPTATYAR